MKFGFISLGCCKNLVDSEKIMGFLVENKQEIVNDPKKADVIVINTCGFIESAKEESINTILEMAEYGKSIIVVGCMAQRYKEAMINELPEIDKLITLDDYDNLGEHLSKFLGVKFTNNYCNSLRYLSTEPWMAYLKIADGCSNRCTFCAIPLIRGPYVSFKMEDILLEAQNLYNDGVKELVLIAQDTTRYGIDLYGEYKLLELLQKISAIGFKWIRVLYMYPDEIDSKLIKGMKELSNVLPYFDIPVQYGEDNMLKLMNRRGSIQSILDNIKLIRETYDTPVIRTTFIVGFPNETDETFKQTINFIKDIEWDNLGAFTYSKEEDTVAYDMKNEVDIDIAQTRLNELIETQKEIVQNKRTKLIDTNLEVLIENYDGLTQRYIGRSIYNAPDGIDGVVYVKTDKELKFGEIYNTTITRIKNYDLITKA